MRENVQNTHKIRRIRYTKCRIFFVTLSRCHERLVMFDRISCVYNDMNFHNHLQPSDNNKRCTASRVERSNVSPSSRDIFKWRSNSTQRVIDSKRHLRTNYPGSMTNTFAFPFAPQLAIERHPIPFNRTRYQIDRVEVYQVLRKRRSVTWI